jgi:hypothetical protein
MKFTNKIFPTGSLVKHRGGLQKTSKDLRLHKLSENELAVYQQEKIKRDIKFFESAVPYILGMTIGITFIIVSVSIYNNYYERKTGQNLWRKLYFNLLDIEEVQVNIEDKK